MMLGPLGWARLASSGGTAPAWTPADITRATVVAWYDVSRTRLETEDGLSVTQLTDLSGNGRHVTNLGTLGFSPLKVQLGNGLAAIQGASTKRLRTTFTSIPQPTEIYVRGKWAPEGTSAIWVDGGTSGRNAIWQQPSAPRKISLFAGSTAVTTHTAPFNADVVAAARFNGAGQSSVEVREVDTETVYSQAALSPGAQGLDGITILSDTGGTSNWTGLFSEGVWISGTLSVEEKEKLIVYLRSREESPGLLNCVEHGNSLTVAQGATVAQSFPNVMRGLLSKYYGITRVGTSGFTTVQLQAQLAGTIVPLIKTGCRNVLSLYELGNDMLGGSTAAQAWANAVAYKNAAVSAGWTGDIIISTIGPRSDLNQVTQVDAVNALVRANAISEGFALVEDIANDAGLAVPATDGIHYNAAQYAILAGLKAAARSAHYSVPLVA